MDMIYMNKKRGFKTKFNAGVALLLVALMVAVAVQSSVTRTITVTSDKLVENNFGIDI